MRTLLLKGLRTYFQRFPASRKGYRPLRGSLHEIKLACGRYR